MPDEPEGPPPSPIDPTLLTKSQDLIAEMDTTLRQLKAMLDQIEAHQARQQPKLG